MAYKMGFSTNDFNSKRFWGVFLILVVLTLISIPTISSFEFDNIKNFDKNIGTYGKVEIRNSVFGWEWWQLDTISTLEVKSNTDVCDGNDCEAVKEIIMFEDGKLIDDIRFIDMKTNSYIGIENYNIQYKLNGVWVNYNYEEVVGSSEGIPYEVKLTGEISNFQKVDWQIKSQGQWIEEWLPWDSSLNDDIQAYWDFNEGTGTIAEDVSGNGNNGTLIGGTTWNVSGILSNAITFTNETLGSLDINESNLFDKQEQTINFWVKPGQPLTVDGRNLYSAGVGGANDYRMYFSSGMTIVAGGTNIFAINEANITQWYNQTAWQMYTIKMKSGANKLYINGGQFNYSSATAWNTKNQSNFTIGDLMMSNILIQQVVGDMDEFSIWNKTITDAELSSLWNEGIGNTYGGLTTPTITLNQPANSLQTANTTLTFNCSSTVGAGSLLNLSLIIDGEFNFTVQNISAVQTAIGLQKNVTLPIGEYSWHCSSGNNLNVTTNSTETRTFSNYYVLLNETYINSTTSGATNDFEISVETDGTQITLAYFYYNNTKSVGSIATDGNKYTMSKSQIAPGVLSATNISFYWNLTIGGDFSRLTDRHNQSVSPINISDGCGAGTYVIYNLTLVDEITQQKINKTTFNTSIKTDLNLYTSDRTLLLSQFNKEFTATNPVEICIDNNLSGGEKYSLDLQIEYGGTNYSTEKYNIERYALNSSSLNQKINLYDLDSDHAQEFKLIVRDSSYTLIGDALVRIERKYIENGTFYVTEIPKTDGNGVTTASLQVDSVIYNFYIYSAGVLISSFPNVVAICQTPTLSTCEIDFNAYQDGLTIPDYQSGDDFNFTIDYNSTSKIVTSQFVVLSGTPATVKLEVIREDTLGTAVCDDTLISASGTLSCVVPNSFGNATVRANLYKDDSIMGWGNLKTVPSPSDIYGGILTIISVLVLMTLIGIAVSDNPVITGTFLLVGVILISSMSLIGSNGFIGAGATFLFLAIAIILVLIKAGRRS